MEHKDIAIERERRLTLYGALKAKSEKRMVSASYLRSQNIYNGAAGIWTHKSFTSIYTEDSSAIAVSVLHSGKHYDDELSEFGILYRYPKTNRKGSHDANEIAALKNCLKHKIPLFVVFKKSKLREVRLARVVRTDDKLGLALLEFCEFRYKNNGSNSLRTVNTEVVPVSYLAKSRPNQANFRFNILKQYGVECSACNINKVELIDAAHIFPKSKGGSDCFSNGLPLCPLHHRAFDAGFFRICPVTHEFIYFNSSQNELNITKSGLQAQERPSTDNLTKAFESWPKISE